MTESKVSICVLFPELLGTYGDGGNAVVLSKRLQWRGIESELVEVSTGQTIPETCDIYVLGGGEDQPQTSVTDILLETKVLNRAVARGAVVFAVCAGMQIIGKSFAVGENTKEGIGLLDITTVRGPGKRRVGELVTDPDPEFVSGRLTGYENHGGITSLGADAKPLARVVSGKGNDDGSGYEGAVSGRVLGTYLHGPGLARNPALADRLLTWAVDRTLEPLDDGDIDELRRERFKSAGALS
jgi:lipid II isoglutaminyl synthase (glutamine-hydrolysing)